MIAGALIQLDPASTDAYTANLRAFLIELDQRIEGWEAQMEPYRGKSVMTYHRTWSYLVEWLDLEVVGELEPLPGIPPNPAHLAELVLMHPDGSVDLIMVEPWSNLTTAIELARQIETGAIVLPVQPGGVPNSAGYLDMIDAVVQRLADNLGGS